MGALGVRERVRENSKPTPTRYVSTKQEKNVAQAVGGKRTSNSGATLFGGKGDILVGGSYESSWLIECKTKMKSSDSISIKKEWIEKNKYEASEMGKANTAIAFSFGPDEENYYIIDEFLFKTLLENMKNE